MADYVIRQSNLRGSQGAAGTLSQIANDRVLGNVSGSTAVPTALTGAQLRELAGAQASTEVSKTTYHTPSTTAVLNGQTIDSGQTPTVTGTGIATTVSSSSGYIHDPTNNNTYIFVNSGSSVKRVVQLFRGTQGVIAICAAGNADNMVHVEFNSSGNAAFTYGKTVGGYPQFPTIAESVASIPNLNDGTTHELVVEVDGDMVTAYVDDVVVGFAYDANISAVVGNWYYTQITGTTSTCKIYGFRSYSELPQSFTVNAGKLISAMVQSQGFHFGRKSLAGYAPDSPFYIYSESGDFVRMVGSTNAIIQLEADGSGHPAQVRFKDALDVEMYVGLSGTNGVVYYQGNNCITFTLNATTSYFSTKTFSTEGIIATSWPTSDPTGNKLWKNGSFVMCGAAPTATPIGVSSAKSIVLVFEGDSLTDAAGSTGSTGCWPYKLRNNYGVFNGAEYNNVATSGNTAATMVGQYSSQVAPLAPSASEVGFFFLLAGTNDMVGGDSAATIYGYLASLWASARADGFKVVAFTVPVNTNWSSHLNATEVKRKAVNNLIRQNHANYDYLIDLDLLTNIPGTIDEITSTSLFSDGIHFTELGNSKIADMVFDALIGNRLSAGNLRTIQNFQRSSTFYVAGPELTYYPDFSKHPGLWTNNGGVCDETTTSYKGFQLVANLIRLYGEDWRLKDTARPGWRAAILADATGDYFQLSRMPAGSSSEDYDFFKVDANKVATFGGPVGLKSYTVAGVPSAAVAGRMIYVSNESGGAVPAFSDGTNWRRVTDRAVVS